MVSSTLQSIICPAFDDQVLANILTKASGHEEVIVKEVEIRDSATNKGDSYLSSIVRFTVIGAPKNNENEEIRAPVICKMIPKNVARKLTFRSHDFFKNEVAFYNDIWDALLKFQSTKNLKNPFMNIPICYAAIADGENDYVALEDLNCQSFTSFRRQNKMDYETVVMIIRLFARFHALSFAYKSQHPKEFEKIASCLQETYFDEKYRKWYAKFHSVLISITRDAVEKELPALYLERFNKLDNDLYGRMCEIAGNVKARFSMICQGDAWIPNFLCKYDSNNQPSEMKLIDFQLAR